MARLNKCYLPFIVTLISVSLMLGIVFYKPSINTVTYFELVEIEGIGDVKANRILDYVKMNDCEVEELILVDGIGDKLIDKLSKDFR